MINPNSNTGFTSGLEDLVAKLGYTDVRELSLISVWTVMKLTNSLQASCDFFTNPESQPPLSSIEDIDLSAKLCMPHLLPYLETHDALLVACFSRHPLVGLLQAEINRRQSKDESSKPRALAVTGILEASVATAMTLAGSTPDRKWGVISTDHSWREWTDSAVSDFLGVDAPKTTIGRYLGCETVGVQAEDLERQGASSMAGLANTAVKQLLSRQDSELCGAPVIILGCAGLYQLEECIKTSCKALLGTGGAEVAVIDGVKVGIGMLLTLVKSRF